MRHVDLAAEAEKIVILDFGAQYSQLIARRVRAARVYCEILPHATPAPQVAARGPKGIILTGGPASVYEEDSPVCDRAIFDLGVPILGICYGMQLMAYLLGGDVRRAEKAEYGKTNLYIDGESGLFRGVNNPTVCWMSHGDYIKEPPPGFSVLAHTGNTPVASMGNQERKFYGVQFHPEVTHTPEGEKILRNFLYEICSCSGTWTMSSFIQESVEAVRRRVGNGQVICGLSGGVDSAVAAALVHRAVGPNLTSVFIDHGLLRKGEAESVVRTFRQGQGMNLVYVDARERFLNRLAGVEDPERKRKIIGEEFIRVFEEEARKIGDIEFLVQGTVYPDVIESGTKTASLIKSHHNVGGLPEDLRFQLIEPLRDLFKDEVRKVGEELGLPEEIIWRQPFPGPGLAIRIIGAVTQEKLDILREADAIVVEEIKKAGLYRELWQSFAVLTSVKSVGVMGDERTYGYTVGLRAVTSTDGMTADWARLPYEVLERIASRVVNEVPMVNRMVYDITSKPPGTIEWE